MQNPIHHQLPYPFNFNLASVFDFSAAQHHQSSVQTRKGMTGRSPSVSPNTSASPAQEMMGHGHFDPCAMSHFLFPPALFGTNGTFGGHHGQAYAGIHGGQDEVEMGSGQMSAVTAASYYKQKMFKKVSGDGKSFTIDSLLGLNTAVARAAFQSGIAQQAQTHHRTQQLVNGVNLTAAMDWSRHQYNNQDLKTGHEPTLKKERFHPYAPAQASLNNNSQNSYKQKGAIVNGTNNQNGATTGDKSQDGVTNLRRVGKAKRVRTIFTPEQLERLEAEFERQQYMVGPERLYLASSLNLTEAQVKVWFQNRRIKWRKQHLEMQQQRLAVLRSQQLDMEEDEESSEFGSSVVSPAPTVASSSVPEVTEPEVQIRTLPSFQPNANANLNLEDSVRSEVKDITGFNNSVPQSGMSVSVSSHMVKPDMGKMKSGGLELDYQR